MRPASALWAILSFVVLVMVAGALFGSPAGRAADDPWIGRDKIKHLAAGAFVAAGVAAQTRNEWAGLAAGAAVGALKEWHDYRARGGVASRRDFAITVPSTWAGLAAIFTTGAHAWATRDPQAIAATLGGLLAVFLPERAAPAGE